MTFASYKYSVISQLHSLPFGMSCTVNSLGTDSRVGGRLHAASFIFNHSQLEYDEWWVLRQLISSKYADGLRALEHSGPFMPFFLSHCYYVSSDLSPFISNQLPHYTEYHI